jgi:hypothetical protein
LKTLSFPHLLSWLTGLVFLGLFALSACTTTKAKGDSNTTEGSASQAEQRARHGTLAPQGFIVETDDLDGDNAPDQWTFRSRDGQVIRVERDMNFSGQVDMWQYFDADGQVIEEEMDLDLDGKVDVVVFYRDGVIARKLLALGFDGVFNIEKFYDGEGQLLRTERDEDGSGVPNVWEYYENGRRVRVGWDTNSDGSPDTFDQF